jgi:hypothetical protein
MKECRFVRRNIYDYVSGIMTDECDKERMDKHINLCRNCFNELEKVKAILMAASNIKPAGLSDEEWQKFDRTLEEKLDMAPKAYTLRPVKKNLYNLLLRPAVILAAVFILITGGFLIRGPMKHAIVLGPTLMERGRPIPSGLSSSENEILRELELMDELNSASSVRDMPEDELLEEMEILDSFET